MFSMWTCFSLLCAATIQSSMSNEEVSLKCSNTVEVVAGEDVTLNCTFGDNCEGVRYQWSNSHGVIQCNSDLKEYICGWDKLTHVNLTISSVTKEDNYTITVQTNCGFANKSIKVRVKQGKVEDVTGLSPSHGHEIPTILGIFITIAAAATAAVGLLRFLFRTDRGRQIIRRMKKEKTQRGDDSEAGIENVLISGIS